MSRFIALVLFAVSVHASADMLSAKERNQLFEPLPPASWRFTHEPQAPEDVVNERQLKQEVEGKVTQCLNTFGVPGLIDLKKDFGQTFFVRFFAPSTGASRLVLTSQKEAESANKEAAEGNIEVVIYGQHAAQHPAILGPLFYREEWKALFVPSYQMTQPWFCATVLHEMFHARLHKLRMERGAGQTSEEALREEVAAHEFERKVLSAYTSGKYSAVLAEIVTTKKTNTIDGFLHALSFKDMQRVQALFPPSTQEEMGVRSAQTFLDLTFLFLERQGKGDLAHKVEGYQRLTQLFQE